jgi:protein-tyrosine phosphatase
MNHHHDPLPPDLEFAANALIMPSHEHQWPHERVAVGSGVWTAEDVAGLVREGITHVIDCRSTAAAEQLYRGTGITFLHAGTDDDQRPKRAEWFRKGVSFARDALSKPSTKVLVHCTAGINRGPSMAYAVLRAIGMGPYEAEFRIREVRPLAGMCYRHDADRTASEWL